MTNTKDSTLKDVDIERLFLEKRTRRPKNNLQTAALMQRFGGAENTRLTPQAKTFGDTNNNTTDGHSELSTRALEYPCYLGQESRELKKQTITSQSLASACLVDLV